MLLIAGLSVSLAASPSYLVVNHLILGSYQNKVWKSLESVAPKKETIKFSAVGLGVNRGSCTVKGVVQGGATEAGYVDGDYTKIPNGVLFSGRVAYPRKVQVLSNANSTYIQVLKTFLAKNKIKSNARITKVVRMDLDGNGTQEVIIEASNRDALGTLSMSDAKEGDYSLVLLRYETKSGVGEYPLAFDRPKAENMSYGNKLEAIADFDFDGVMEVVVSSHYYEGHSGMLFRYKKDNVAKLVEMGDGA